MPDHSTQPDTPKVEDTTRTQAPREIAWWRIAVIGAGALFLALALAGFMVLTARALALLFIAIVIAEALMPLVRRVDRFLPRGAAVFTVYLSLLAVIAGGIWLMVPQLVSQGEEIVAEVPKLVESGERLLEDLGGDSEDALLNALQTVLGGLGDVLVNVPMTVVSSVTQVVLVFFMSAYWLISRPHLHRFVQSLVPQESRASMDDVLGELGATVGGYVRGEVIAGAIIGILTYVGLLVLDVRFALVLALLAALGELIPVIGPIVTAIPAIGVALLDSPTQALIVTGFYLVLQQVESNLVIPNVMSSQADIPPLLVIVSLFGGGAIGGILGAIVAIPMAGAVKVLATRVAAPAIRRWTGAVDDAPPGEPADSTG